MCMRHIHKSAGERPAGAAPLHADSLAFRDLSQRRKVRQARMTGRETLYVPPLRSLRLGERYSA